MVENNVFRVFDPRIVNLYYVDGFTFRDNKIEMTADYPYSGDVKDHFIYKNSKNIVIK